LKGEGDRGNSNKKNREATQGKRSARYGWLVVVWCCSVVAGVASLGGGTRGTGYLVLAVVAAAMFAAAVKCCVRTEVRGVELRRLSDAIVDRRLEGRRKLKLLKALTTRKRL
jgi:hypothetical protein